MTTEAELIGPAFVSVPTAFRFIQKAYGETVVPRTIVRGKGPFRVRERRRWPVNDTFVCQFSAIPDDHGVISYLAVMICAHFEDYDDNGYIRLPIKSVVVDPVTGTVTIKADRKRVCQTRVHNI